MQNEEIIFQWHIDLFVKSDARAVKCTQEKGNKKRKMKKVK